MYVPDYAHFKCPACSQPVLVSAIAGQNFGNRIETPAPFSCPHCETAIVFSTRTRNFLRTGMFIALFGTPAAYYWIDHFPTTLILFVVGLLLSFFALLTQKLVVADPLELMGIERQMSGKDLFLAFFGVRNSKPTVRVTDGPDGERVGLHVLSDYGDIHRFISDTPNRRIIIDTIRELDWENGFHSVILIKQPGLSLEVGGSLDPSDGLSSVYTDEANGAVEVTIDPPQSIGEMENLLVDFLGAAGRWRQMHQFN